jgi:hypothetical protein
MGLLVVTAVCLSCLCGHPRTAPSHPPVLSFPVLSSPQLSDTAVHLAWSQGLNFFTCESSTIYMSPSPAFVISHLIQSRIEGKQVQIVHVTISLKTEEQKL